MIRYLLGALLLATPAFAAEPPPACVSPDTAQLVVTATKMYLAELNRGDALNAALAQARADQKAADEAAAKAKDAPKP